MIHRIEAGWVQINDALSKQKRRPRRRLRKFRTQEREEAPVQRREVGKEEETVTIDLVA